MANVSRNIFRDKNVVSELQSPSSPIAHNPCKINDSNMGCNNIVQSRYRGEIADFLGYNIQQVSSLGRVSTGLPSQRRPSRAKFYRNLGLTLWLYVFLLFHQCSLYHFRTFPPILNAYLIVIVGTQLWARWANETNSFLL